ncbi:hypothetical protein HR09_08660 [Porphyromonas gulae]|nr:hypothetical protein HR09_08660 [Porphyromonas gulae]
MVSYKRILWSHTRGYYGLIQEDIMFSYEKIMGLLMEDAICSVSDGRFGEWEIPCELLNR